jgi:hypothetical protein
LRHGAKNMENILIEVVNELERLKMENLTQAQLEKSMLKFIQLASSVDIEELRRYIRASRVLMSTHE